MSESSCCRLRCATRNGKLAQEPRSLQKKATLSGARVRAAFLHMGLACGLQTPYMLCGMTAAVLRLEGKNGEPAEGGTVGVSSYSQCRMNVSSAGCFCGLLACLHFRRSYYTVLPLTFAVSAACSFKSNQFFLFVMAEQLAFREPTKGKGWKEYYMALLPQARS